jgi:hypothetical protein
MANLTNKQRAERNLANAKLRNVESPKPIKIVPQGITGERITGVRKWN